MVETRRSSILGPDGAPIEIPLLAGETAEPQRQGPRAIVYYNEASGLTPTRLAAIMREANLGQTRALLTLAYDMEERYFHYAAQLQTRRLALDNLTISVDAPKGVDARAVELVEQLIADPMFPDLVQSLQDGVGKGYAVVEPRWEYQDGALAPVEYQERDQRFFRYDEVSQRKLCLLAESGLPGEELAAPYFITHQPYTRAGAPNRRGLMRPAAWAFVIQSFALQDWSAFCEIYGVPFRLGKYNTAATAADKATLLRAVRNIASDAAAIIPEGMMIEFHETNGARGEAVFGNIIDHVDGKVSLLVLGQTLTSNVGKNGGALATAQVHENVRMDIVRFDGRSLASTLNRDLVRPAVAMNFGPQAVYPKLKLEITENEDLNALANFVDKVAGRMRIPAKHIRDRAGIPEPMDDEEVLVDKTAQSDPSHADPQADPSHADPAHDGRKAAKLAAEPGAPDALTAIDDTQALVDDALHDWQALRDPLFAGLLSAVSGARDFEDAARRIAAATIDSTPLVDELAKAATKSRGLGDVRD